MPKSKRDKKISLTRTQKKGLESKQNLVEEIRKCIDKFARVFVFSVQNYRNNKFKEVRMEWQHNSRFFMGKNKVMALALGKSPETEVADNIHQISLRLIGPCGILFTNQTRDDVLKFFEDFSEPGFARSGDIATEIVELDEGPLEQFPHSIEPQLRLLGLPTSLKRGVPTLLQDFTVCRTEDKLTPEQARILKLLGKQMSSFKLMMDCMWTRVDGSFEEFDRPKHDITDDQMDLKLDSEGDESEDDDKNE